MQTHVDAGWNRKQNVEKKNTQTQNADDMQDMSVMYAI